LHTIAQIPQLPRDHDPTLGQSSNAYVQASTKRGNCITQIALFVLYRAECSIPQLQSNADSILLLHVEHTLSAREARTQARLRRLLPCPQWTNLVSLSCRRDISSIRAHVPSVHLSVYQLPASITPIKLTCFHSWIKAGISIIAFFRISKRPFSVRSHSFPLTF
jgi:hypothetical protein